MRRARYRDNTALSCRQQDLTGSRHRQSELRLEGGTGVVNSILHLQPAAENGLESTASIAKGLLIGLPETVFQSINAIPSNFVLDGEGVGDLFHAFDLLEWEGEDLRSMPFLRRLVKLSTFFNRPSLRHIRFVETATDPANKARLFRHLQAARKEGVVCKRLNAPYTSGRPNSGGNQLKHKFYGTCSAIVAKERAHK